MSYCLLVSLHANLKTDIFSKIIEIHELQLQTNLNALSGGVIQWSLQDFVLTFIQVQLWLCSVRTFLETRTGSFPCILSFLHATSTEKWKSKVLRKGHEVIDIDGKTQLCWRPHGRVIGHKDGQVELYLKIYEWLTGCLVLVFFLLTKYQVNLFRDRDCRLLPAFALVRA